MRSFEYNGEKQKGGKRENKIKNVYIKKKSKRKNKKRRKSEPKINEKKQVRFV